MEALKYVFRHSNTQPLSSGAKHISVDGVRRYFPAVLRKRTMESMWRGYNEEMENINVSKGDQLGRTNMIALMSSVTKESLKKKSCVAYMLTTSVYENIENFRRFVNGEVEDRAQRTVLVNQVDAVEEYIKFYF